MRFFKNKIIENSSYFQLKNIIDALKCPLNPTIALIKLMDTLNVGMESINRLSDCKYSILVNDVIITITLDIPNRKYILDRSFDIIKDSDDIEIINSF